MALIALSLEEFGYHVSHHSFHFNSTLFLTELFCSSQKVIILKSDESTQFGIQYRTTINNTKENTESLHLGYSNRMHSRFFAKKKK